MGIKGNIVFSTTPFLVTLDGPDGAGKSTFSEFLAQEIQKNVGSEKVKLFRPTRFDATPETSEIGAEFEKASKKLKPNSKSHNAFFLRTIEVNYRQVINPSIQAQQLVIVDSSEIRALAFILERGTSAAKKDTVVHLKRGILTQRIKPTKRIILYAQPEDLSRNLSIKSELNIGDPRNMKEIKKRIGVYRQALQIIRNVEGDDGVEWIFIHIKHTPKLLFDYFLEIIARYNLLQRLIPYPLLENSGRRQK